MGAGVEFLAMGDNCVSDLNSGFLYYRPTNKTIEMLDISLATIADHSFSHDNDQYLLNCGFNHVALEGLKYRILPRKQFIFGVPAATSRICGKTSDNNWFSN